MNNVNLKGCSLAQQAYVNGQIRRRQMVVTVRLLLLCIFLILWEICARFGIINDFIFSSPSKVARTIGEMISDKSMFYHTGITFLETMISFTAVTLIGIGGAVLLWISKDISEILDPYLVMLNSLPKSALAPILIVWLGANMKTIVAASVSVAVFGSILTLYNGFCNLDPDQEKLIYSLGGKRRDVLIKLLLPGAVPMIVSNMKVNIGLCLVGVIIGEFLAARAGLGYLIIYGSQVFQLTTVMTSILILCVLSALMYRGIEILERFMKRR